jgi:uncharacterized protein (TIGR02271 family)
VSKPEEERAELVVPVIEEELTVDKRPIPIGTVQVRKHLEQRTETIDLPLVREEVDIRRVVIGKEVAHVPATREEGDVIIIPIVEEEIVVTKRLILKEELHLPRRRSVHRFAEQVVLNRETAEVTRLDSEGRQVAPGIREESPAPSRGRRSRILRED